MWKSFGQYLIVLLTYNELGLLTCNTAYGELAF